MEELKLQAKFHGIDIDSKDKKTIDLSEVKTKEEYDVAVEQIRQLFGGMVK